MQRLAASLILLFIDSWGYAQNDLTIYRKNGKKVEMKNATTETRASNVYITDGNGKTKVYSQSSLDSITGLREGFMNFNTDVTLYTKNTVNRRRGSPKTSAENKPGVCEARSNFVSPKVLSPLKDTDLGR